MLGKGVILAYASSLDWPTVIQKIFGIRGWLESYLSSQPLLRDGFHRTTSPTAQDVLLQVIPEVNCPSLTSRILPRHSAIMKSMPGSTVVSEINGGFYALKHPGLFRAQGCEQKQLRSVTGYTCKRQARLIRAFAQMASRVKQHNGYRYGSAAAVHEPE
jgi:hypothetical protein